MSKIMPYLWFDKEAKEAAEFYSSVFPKSKISSVTVLRNTPSGDCEEVSFELWGQRFTAISAGPPFKINPSISFIVSFDPSHIEGAREKLDKTWQTLSVGGETLVPLGEYPFSKRYGWLQDRYGLSWQLILNEPSDEGGPSIVPCLLFVDENCGRAEEAVNFYLSVFRNTKPGSFLRYGADQAPNKEGTVMFSEFMLEGEWFTAVDSAEDHGFSFNEAVSFVVNCENQDEIDYYGDELSAVPGDEQCGWLKDKYGVSWQIVSTLAEELINSGDQAKADRVIQSILKMKRINIEEIKKAAGG